MLLRKTSIGGRLVISHGALIILLVFLALLSGVNLHEMQKSAEFIVKKNLVKTKIASEAEGLARETTLKLYQLLNAPDQAARSGIYKETDEDKAQLKISLERLETISSSTQELLLIQSVRSASDRFSSSFSSAADLIEVGDKTGADVQINSKTLPALKELTKNGQAIVDYEQQMAEFDYHNGEVRYSRLITLLSLISVAAVIAAIGIATALSRSIVTPIHRARHAAEKMAHGDMTDIIEDAGMDEAAMLIRSLESMRGAVHQMIDGIKEEARKVSVASTELCRSVRNIIESSSRQALLANSIAQSANQLTHEAQHIAENAQASQVITETGAALSRQGQDLITKAADNIETLAEIVFSATTDVSSLQTRTQGIARFVTTIREIADQTNLLALNAAIEAARAGDSGRGFAVVADEVRNLSIRAASVTTEITDIIVMMGKESAAVVTSMHTGSRDMQEGVALVQGMVGPLVNLQERSAEALELLGRLVDTTRDQYDAAEDIKQNVKEISTMASDNDRVIQNLSLMSQSLDSLADKLLAMAEVFRVR